MDPQLVLASKDDFWRLQNEMKNVYATQAEHADRLARLEQRQDADARSKSPWSQSPFPSAMNGTSQQGQAFNTVSEDFRNFDQNLLGSLHLDAEEVEPRRGTSRANSVRFDVSASGHGARGSQEYLPLRTGSAFGSQPMTERSSSHKSDGRQSSAGQSIHSARASSFGYETRPLSATVPAFVPLGPPPGLFILGPVPSIIRCWLNQNFRSEAMLYAVVCTGSYKSIVDSSLLSRLGYEEEITTNQQGERFIKLPVYLPEATLQTTSSRSSSPLHHLPILTTEFLVQDYNGQVGSMQIFLGCDVLRARNADIHFSLDRLTVFDDERNKVSVQLVRPENAAVYQNLQTGCTIFGQVPGSNYVGKSQTSEAPTTSLETEEAIAESEAGGTDDLQEGCSHTHSTINALPTPAASSPSVIGEGHKFVTDRTSTGLVSAATNGKTDMKDAGSLNNGTTPDTPTKAESSNVWGSWRRDSNQGGRVEGVKEGPSSSGYQRAGRGRGMKVLKPARLITSRSTSIQQQPVGFEAGDPRSAGSPADKAAGPQSAAFDRRTFSGDAKPALPSATSKPRSANPIGGASAFGWLTSSQAKSSTGAAE